MTGVESETVLEEKEIENKYKLTCKESVINSYTII